MCAAFRAVPGDRYIPIKCPVVESCSKLSNELCDLKTGGWLGGGSNGDVESKSLSEDVQEWVIRRKLLSHMCED